jgi:hypothetical protein
MVNNTETIPEARNEDGAEAKDGIAEGPASPATNCVGCAQVLSEDEVTINQRFIDQALTSTDTTSSDVAHYPLCVKCLFE